VLQANNLYFLQGTESHLNDSEIFPSNNSVFRKDTNIHRGGVLMVEKIHIIINIIVEIESS